MPDDAPPDVGVPNGYLGHGQFRHVLLLAALLPGAWAVASPNLGDGAWLGIADHTWFWAAIAVPIVQQVAVVIVWRLQLCHRLVTRILGRASISVWGAFFVPLLVARPLGVLAVGLADQGSLPIPPRLGWISGGMLLLPAVWTMHSVRKYFGLSRALGGDHFYERFRAMPMVRQGAFAYSSNAMYMFAFVGLWGVAMVTRSQAAIAVALFQHAYIWVHWYCTEQPDGVVLYGRSPDEGGT